MKTSPVDLIKRLDKIQRSATKTWQINKLAKHPIELIKTVKKKRPCPLPKPFHWGIPYNHYQTNSKNITQKRSSDMNPS